jgi:hypothetical protein
VLELQACVTTTLAKSMSSVNSVGENWMAQFHAKVI